MNIATPDFGPDFGSAEASRGADFLAAVPVVPIPVDSSASGRFIGLDSHDERVRAFNLLRSRLLKDIGANPARLIGITSATPSAGKSFVSLNLAAALSKIADRRVLICDFDLRRGSILDALGTSTSTDVSAYLRGDLADWRSAVVRVGESDLYVLPCQKHLRGSGELLTSQRFGKLLDELRALPRDILVICDLPPVFASDDALLTAEKLDGYVLVVEYGRNTKSQVSESMAMLAPTPCLGTILNRYRGGFFDAYGYGYGDLYGIKNYGASTSG